MGDMGGRVGDEVDRDRERDESVVIVRAGMARRGRPSAVAEEPCLSIKSGLGTWL